MEHVNDAIQPIVDAGLVDFITPGHRITDEVSLIPTPGHTAGHVSVHISSRGQDAVITGDVVHHPVQLALPDWENNFDFDKDRGAEIFIRAIGGRYDVLRPGQPTGLNPLHLPDTAENRAFLAQWLERLANPENAPLDPEERALIVDAIDANFSEPPEHRPEPEAAA